MTSSQDEFNEIQDTTKKADTAAKGREETDDEGKPLANADFMREKIKSRPINSKKLLRRTIITIAMAVLFGLVACCTFLLLEPVLNNQINSRSGQADQPAIYFPSEIVSDEIQRKDLIASEEEKAAADAASAQASVTETVTEAAEKEIQAAFNSFNLSSSDYASMYESLKEIAQSASTSVVTVTGTTSETDFINDPFVREGSASGLIIASTDLETLILTYSANLTSAEGIFVTFSNGEISSAAIRNIDPFTDMCIIAVENREISPETSDIITTAALGSSLSASLVGTPVIAIGSPTGTAGSMCYGMITSSQNMIDLPDSAYRLMMTDIYGSTSASGVLVNLNGDVIGIINMNYNARGQENLLSAIGISDLKTLIQNLSNDTMPPYLGIHASDVPAAMIEAEDVPAGVYVTKIEMDSPAMRAGIQSGDIIVGVGEREIKSYGQLLTELSAHTAGSEVKITVMRLGPDGYTDLEITATLSEAPDEYSPDKK